MGWYGIVPDYLKKGVNVGGRKQPRKNFLRPDFEYYLVVRT